MQIDVLEIKVVFFEYFFGELIGLIYLMIIVKLICCQKQLLWAVFYEQFIDKNSLCIFIVYFHLFINLWCLGHVYFLNKFAFVFQRLEQLLNFLWIHFCDFNEFFKRAYIRAVFLNGIQKVSFCFIKILFLKTALANYS